MVEAKFKYILVYPFLNVPDGRVCIDAIYPRRSQILDRGSRENYYYCGATMRARARTVECINSADASAANAKRATRSIRSGRGLMHSVVRVRIHVYIHAHAHTQSQGMRSNPEMAYRYTYSITDNTSQR